jgi:hypothetical protein
MLANILWHLFHVVLFEECYFLFHQVAKVLSPQPDCQLLSSLDHEGVHNIAKDPYDERSKQDVFEQRVHQIIQR